MRRKSSLTLIGAFVIGAIVLAVVGIAILGSGRFFEQRKKFVIYFNESIKGLTVGSAVTFQGVKIGEVSFIGMQFDARNWDFTIPVVVEIANEQVIMTHAEEGAAIDDYRDDEMILTFINRGLRAQLQLESLVTGRLYIEFAFHPDKPARLMAMEALGPDMEITEVPSIESDHRRLSDTLRNLPLQEIVRKVLDALDGINRLARLPEIPQTFRSVQETLTRIDRLADNLNGKTDSIGSELEGTIKDARGVLDNLDREIASLAENLARATGTATTALESADEFLSNGEEMVADLAASIKDVAEAARAALVHISGAMGEMETMLEDDSVLRVSFTELIDELTQMARGLKEAADYIERHPESLLRGKGAPKGK